MYSVLIVATKSGTPICTTRNPLNRPIRQALASATAIAAGALQPASTHNTDMIMPAKPATRPVEMSTLPVISTNDAPNATIAINGICVNIAEKFLIVKKSRRKSVVTSMIIKSGMNTLTSSERSSRRAPLSFLRFALCVIIPPPYRTIRRASTRFL